MITDIEAAEAAGSGTTCSVEKGKFAGGLPTHIPCFYSAMQSSHCLAPNHPISSHLFRVLREKNEVMAKWTV